MKILGVKFKNINTLTGEWEIRFDQSPIADTRLFAIVGPNGSGKSSILDAITLGLYGETARLKNPEYSRLTGSGTESRAEVTFSVMDHLYCSQWVVKQNGHKPESPDMSLYSLNGEKKLLENRPIPVRTRIEAVTGLDFKRFCRSILLAQGECSAFLNALENERTEILEKIIGPEMRQELAESIRSRVAVETERLHQLQEEAAGFQTPEKARVDDIRQSIEQAREDAREIGRNLDILQAQERWTERMAREPDAEKNAAEALRVAEIRLAELQNSRDQLEQAKPAGLFQKALAQVETLRANADAIRTEIDHLKADLPARENQLQDIEARRDEVDRQHRSVKDILDARIRDFQEAETLDRDISAMEQAFMDKTSRLEAGMKTQQDTSRIRSELEEQEKILNKRFQELQEWIEAHAADEGLAAAIPDMESHVAQLATIRQQMETCRTEREQAAKAESRSARVLERAEKSARKAREKVAHLQARKTDRDSRLQAIFGGKTESGLKTDIDDGIKKLAACKELKRIGKKSGAFKTVRYELAQSRLEIKTLTESIAQEQSRLQALDGEIRKRDAIRRFEADRGNLLEPEAPCPLCGATVHPFLDDGIIDFSELDRIVLERREKIRALQAERDSLKTRETGILERVKIRNDLQQTWDSQCALAGSAWNFGETGALPDHVRAIRQDIRNVRSRLRSAWWLGWRVTWTDRSLGRKRDTLSRCENLLKTSRIAHETPEEALHRIDRDLARLGETDEKTRAALIDGLKKWQEQAPNPGDENTMLTHLTDRSAVYRQNRRELAAAQNDLQSIRSRQQAVSDTLQQTEKSSQHLSAEIEDLQSRLNALKADRGSRFGALDPAREHQTLKNEIQGLAAEERSLSAESDRLHQNLATDRETLKRMVDQELEIRNTAAAAEKDLLEQARTEGFDTLKAIQDGLSILAREPDILSRLADAEGAVKTALESVESLRPEHPVTDSPETLRWKISDAIKRQKELEQDIDNQKRTLETYRQADIEYRELLHAIAVQEKVFAEAVAAHRSIDGQGKGQEKLQHLLLNQLLEKANRHLGTLANHRYLLKPAGPDDLGLYVEDTIQSGILRSVKTLSGGESFIVSLCLALGLSDMAANHRRIDSLFLDEGFGKLDDEMLYKVIATLKSLRANGRMVGIVSHVRRLTDEIPTQIRLEKGADGSSKIMVVA